MGESVGKESSACDKAAKFLNWHDSLPPKEKKIFPIDKVSDCYHVYCASEGRDGLSQLCSSIPSNLLEQFRRQVLGLDIS